MFASLRRALVGLAVIASAITRLRARGATPDTITVVDELTRAGQLEPGVLHAQRQPGSDPGRAVRVEVGGRRRRARRHQVRLARVLRPIETVIPERGEGELARTQQAVA